MEFSEKWLREWVNPNIDTSSLCNQITQLGLEVEKVTYIPNVCKNLIVGEITEILKHYFDIQLLLIKVKIGKNKYIKVISRHANFSKNIKVIIATHASTLFNYDFFKLVQSKNILHDGIICFCEDIGFISSNDDIIVLSSNSIIGNNACEYLSLDDNIIKISSTPNRSDALSILGIARDIAAWNDLPTPCFKKYPNIVRIPDKLKISIDIPDICLRFFGRIIKNINTQRDTPFWIREKLVRSSLKSSNIIIDIVHYILIELGQPLYIIDLDCVLKKIIVRKSYKNEIFINSNNEKISIDSDVIVISDEEKVLVLGGHINSFISAVNLTSCNLFLGIGSYDSSNIFERSFKYGCKNIFTERYERGIDFGEQEKALEYATYLITQLCNGKSGKVEQTIKSSEIFCRKDIKLHKRKLNSVSGFFISDALVVFNLKKLGFKITSFDKYWKVISPSWRFDIIIEEEIIGELFRILGYQNIPSFPMETYCNVVRENEVYSSLNRAKLFLVDQGYHEIITYGFVDPYLQKLLFPDIVPLYISNPISKEISAMRVSLLIGLCSTVLYNQNRQENRFRLFESGLCFVKSSQEKLGVKQILCLSGILSGKKNELHWDMSKKKIDFFDLKGDVESIMDLFGQSEFLEFKKCNIPGLYSGQSVKIYLKNKMIGIIGVISLDLQKKLNLKNEIVIFEIIWDRIPFSYGSNIKYFSRYPRSFRDISIIVDETISVGDIIAECKRFFLKNILDIFLFDIFRSHEIGIGKKSLSFRFVLENEKQTFTEIEISQILKTCIVKLELKFNAVLRNK
ncbi:MAG: phenylalanine--tRNA ligase subunit beta [Buchnera aphidicola (Nurudea yanoniella)]